MKIIAAVVAGGHNKGITLKPHRYSAGYYLISKGGRGGNKRDSAKEVYIESELESWMQQGYGIRMSGPQVPPSLYMPKSLAIQIV